MPAAADDKYSRGVLGVVAGGEPYTGAAVLSVTAAVAAGAGMVRYVGTADPDGARARRACPRPCTAPGRVQAWVVGPGLDAAATGRRRRAQLDAARDSARPPTAGASSTPVASTCSSGPRRAAPTLLTPHAGELARLLTPARPARGRRGQRRRRRPRWPTPARSPTLTGATVLLKGVDDAGRRPRERRPPVRSQADAPAWLATAGAGDVLAGLPAPCSPLGWPRSTPAALGALVHGVAADAANPAARCGRSRWRTAYPAAVARPAGAAEGRAVPSQPDELGSGLT